MEQLFIRVLHRKQLVWTPLFVWSLDFTILFCSTCKQQHGQVLTIFHSDCLDAWLLQSNMTRFGQWSPGTQLSMG